MKKTILALAVVGVFALAMGLASAAPANFAGTWGLDKAKSEGLPQQMANADQTMVVTQDAKQFSYTTTVTVDGQARPATTSTYNLDGSETTAEIQGRMPGKATRKAKWVSDSLLELNEVRNVNVQGNDIQIKTTEHWELADGGKTLKVHRTSETPQGSRETKLTFAKK
jgi:hypothetical protein